MNYVNEWTIFPRGLLHEFLTVFSCYFNRIILPFIQLTIQIEADVNFVRFNSPLPVSYNLVINYNNGVNYCGLPNNYYCAALPNAIAISQPVDLTGLPGMPHISFDTWMQLDGPLPGGTGFGDGTSDVPLVILRDTSTKQVLNQFLLSKSTTDCNGPCQSVWRNIAMTQPKVAGHKFRIELSLWKPTNWGNTGKGWFVDNFTVSTQFAPEVCDNKLDDDGNGRTDCADPACVGVGVCP